MYYDVVIIGAGSMGMAAGYYLSKQHKSVALIDTHDPPHTEGSHHGETRIIRHAYGEGESYVPMALRAQELWLELEKTAKTKLFYQTGVLNIGREGSAFIENVLKGATKHSLPLEKLSAKEIHNRWSGFDVTDNLIGCYESTSGVLMSEACVKAYRDLATGLGATLLTHTNVKRIESRPGDVTIETNQETIHGKELIISAGKGTNDILALLDKELPLQPVRKTFSWFHANEAIYAMKTFPAWTCDVAGDTYYGFPSINGAGVKVGRHAGGISVNPSDILDSFNTYPEDKGDVGRLINTIMPEELPHKEGKVCTYTNTPDGDFIIDRLDDYPNITIACGFSGHGFKFSSVVGEILSEMVIDGQSKQNISRFTLGRF